MNKWAPTRPRPCAESLWRMRAAAFFLLSAPVRARRLKRMPQFRRLPCYPPLSDTAEMPKRPLKRTCRGMLSNSSHGASGWRRGLPPSRASAARAMANRAECSRSQQLSSLPTARWYWGRTETDRVGLRRSDAGPIGRFLPAQWRSWGRDGGALGLCSRGSAERRPPQAARRLDQREAAAVTRLRAAMKSVDFMIEA